VSIAPMEWDDLGKSFSLTESDSGLKEGMFTLHEVGELLRRAAIEAGLVACSEHRLKAFGKFWKIDWIWRKKGGDDIVAAFELDGRSIDDKNTNKALISLSSIRAPTKYLILFQVDHDLKPKPKATKYVEKYADEFKSHNIELKLDAYLDEEWLKSLISRAKSGTEAGETTTPIKAIKRWNARKWSKQSLASSRDE